MLAPGMQVDRYELVCPVGEGGMAQVWVARQKGKHGFEKLFAFKAIHARFAEDPVFRGMFLDEARIAASIDHANVAQVFDLGESSSMLYLVMEYVDGESLGSLVLAAGKRAQASATVPVAVAARIIADVCAGLHAAHRLVDKTGLLLGVVHRDVSPQNILVSVRGDVKVIDFGIAHAKDRIAVDTQDGSVKGKLHYMAPEQARRETLGAYTDVFAAGATLYRMLAGHPPFDAGNDAATLQMLLSDKSPPPLPDAVPPLVAAIVERALSPDPGDRYATAFGMQTALEGAIAAEGLVPDVGGWVLANLSERAKDRRKDLASRTMNINAEAAQVSRSSSSPPPPALADGAPSFSFDLGPIPVKPESIAVVSAEPISAEPISPTLASAASVAPGAAAAVPEIIHIEVPKRPSSAELEARPRPAPPVPALDFGKSPPPKPPLPSPLSPASMDPPSDEPSSSDPMKPAAGPGMMDVRALVARKASPAQAPPATPVAVTGSSNGLHTSRAVRELEEEAQSRPGPAIELAVAPRGSQDPKTGRSLGAGWVKIAALAVVVVFLLSGFLLLLPRIVQDRIISSAREAGVELTIERIGLGASGVALRGVHAKLARVPNVDFVAEEVYATGFSARDVRVRGLGLTIDGPWQDTGAALLRFYEDSRPRFAGTPSEPRRIAIVAAHITWNGIVGEGSRLTTSDAGLELDSKGAGQEEIRGSIGHFEIATKRTTFGPWAASYERNPSASRLRVSFDPPVPDGPSALYVYGTGVSPRLTVRIPRSPIARLGVRPEQLGLPADPATELEVKLEIGQAPSTRIEAGGRIDLFAAQMKGIKGNVDIKIEGNANGMPGKPLELEKTSATIGPFVANISGTVLPSDQGVRLDAAWRTVPIACEKLAKAEAKSLGGSVAVALQELAKQSGFARVTGTATASGIVKYDSKTPDDASVTFATRDTCGLAIFGK